MSAESEHAAEARWLRAETDRLYDTISDLRKENAHLKEDTFNDGLLQRALKAEAQNAEQHELLYGKHGFIGEGRDAWDECSDLAAERDLLKAEVERLKAHAVTLWECAECLFRFDARHSLADGSHSCPNCAEARLEVDLKDARAAHVTHVATIGRKLDAARAQATAMRAALEACEWIYKDRKVRCPLCECTKVEDGGDGHDQDCLVLKALATDAGRSKGGVSISAGLFEPDPEAAKRALQVLGWRSPEQARAHDELCESLRPFPGSTRAACNCNALLKEAVREACAMVAEKYECRCDFAPCACDVPGHIRALDLSAVWTGDSPTDPAVKP